MDVVDDEALVDLLAQIATTSKSWNFVVWKRVSIHLGFKNQSMKYLISANFVCMTTILMYEYMICVLLVWVW